ncbi:MAG: response regulator [Deltaproteobacteria bacterium]
MILVVEDDSNHAELIQRSFDDDLKEYRLEIVSNLDGARSVMDVQIPDLVLTDFRLPDGYGSDLVVLAHSRCPVIIMSSHGNEQIAVEAMKIGAQDYIVKSPETFENLPRTVAYALMTWALIVARRQASDAVFRSKKDWERTFDAVPDLISIIDHDHTITRVNKAMADRCGVTPGELVGRKCCEVVHGLNTPPLRCPRADMIAHSHASHERIAVDMLNGVFDITVSPLINDEGRITGCVHIMRDVTEHLRIEEDRKGMERQLQHTQKLESLGVLSGGIAHDFNNILTIILGHCFILKENIDSDVERETHVRMIESAANRAADLCHQMLAYAGKSPLLQTEFSLWMLVDEIVKMLTSAIKKNVIIKPDIKCDIPMIVGDSSQIQQVIMNLIINACEAIGESSGQVTVGLKKNTIQLDQPEIDYFGGKILPGSYACLEVSDSGCGMSEETMNRVFEPFYTTKFAGRGLGMSAILGIVKAHNGTLQLTSTPGDGTTFKVYFPLIMAPVQDETVPLAIQADTALSKATILLVDDEETLRDMETTLLEALGFVAITAANGREALDIYKVRGNEIDLVILDLIMPEMGGVEAYHELRRIDAKVPIIICSGYGVESVADVIAADTRSGFLHKPYNPIELCRVIKEKIGV